MSDQAVNTSIFKKALQVGEAVLEAQLNKARNSLRPSEGPDFNFGKAVTRDIGYQIGAQGWHEKGGSIGFEYQRHISRKSSIIAAIIKTRQNKVAAYAKPVKDESHKGFRIVLKDREKALKDLREELLGEEESEFSKSIKKAAPNDLGGDSETEEDQELSDQEIDRKLKKELERRNKDKIADLTKFIQNCGETEDRPFETKKWNFDAFLKAIVWDSLVFDQIAVELVPVEAQKSESGKLKVHHFQPIDGATIRYASPQLSKYRGREMLSAYDILYPEEELKALQEKDALELDEERLEAGEYKYVQVIRGKIERAFTEDELAFGMRNPITDIYSNGYSLSEIELLLSLISSHLHTENYNRQYFQQGFSAKGILHVKANLPRAKLEELRRHWYHMVKGGRNAFQTPILSGMSEVQWIPLTQNHSEMEFSLWLNYLIKMICSIYQIDPAEIGYGMREEGGTGGSMSGDNTEEKLQNSKDKGLVPLMGFIASFINTNIIDRMAPDFKFEWVGLEQEDPKAVLERQEKEVAIKKSINEIRAEDGLPPIPGADHLVLNPVYFQWYSQFHPEGRKLAQENQEQQMMMDQQANEQGFQEQEEEPNELSPEEQAEMEEEAKQADHEREKEIIEHKAKVDAKYSKNESPKQVKKSRPLKIEYYTLED